MNISIPVIECYVRLEFMNQEDPAYKGRFAEAQVFGVASLPGNTPLFHILCDDGGIYWRLPLHALCWKQDAPEAELEDLVMWDSFSHHVHAHRFDLLANKRMTYFDRNKKTHSGIYLFTLDWFGDGRFHGFAEVPGQHKCFHMIRLDDGNFAGQPNNRVLVSDPNFVTKDQLYPRKIADKLYSSENLGKWRTSDDEEYRYELRVKT